MITIKNLLVYRHELVKKRDEVKFMENKLKEYERTFAEATAEQLYSLKVNDYIQRIWTDDLEGVRPTVAWVHPLDPDFGHYKTYQITELKMDMLDPIHIVAVMNECSHSGKLYKFSYKHMEKLHLPIFDTFDRSPCHGCKFRMLSTMTKKFNCAADKDGWAWEYNPADILSMPRACAKRLAGSPLIYQRKGLKSAEFWCLAGMYITTEDWDHLTEVKRNAGK